ncbi:FecR family protein [Litorimonas taeanensis]|uniref:FecR family protein n=1 Tax=Litorimonas taeanensis TaxID=568099 RepID=A0A420WF90_9PROT|nr:FecR domain-containing protein [Litorimonas taeanensis]RKQ69642.1 FecR family protein [Litorimonas taeanensis]
MTSQTYNHSDLSYPENDAFAEAAYWFTILQNENCAEAERRAFSLWLSKSPLHEEAYDQMVMLYEGAGALQDDEDILALRREYLGLGKTRARVHILKRASFVVAAMAAMFIAMIAIWPDLSSHLQQDNTEQYADKLEPQDQQADTNSLLLTTAVGEQLTRTLNDGSLIELNTDSEVRVHLSADQRSIYLLKGQAVFSVAHDESRPFVVFAGSRRVTALGTLFEVRLDLADAQVTLLEGKVKVDEVNLSDKAQKKPTAKPVELLPGDRYLSATNEMTRVDPTRIQSDLSWRNGRHIFVDEKISVIVAELNRYTERKIIINDPKIGDLKASANFKMGSTQSLSMALEATFNLSLRNDTTANTIIIDWK